jgi:hypothetical protein
MYETKSADTLKERIHQTYQNQLQHVLTTAKRVNKTDAENLASQFGVSTFWRGLVCGVVARVEETRGRADGI